VLPVHTGPGTLAGRYLRQFWQPVARSQDVVSGRAKPVRIMSQDFTLYRGESGVAHLVDFRCAHRGTQLSTGWVEGECIRCFYHGWKYDQTGQCVEQPAEDAGFAAKIRIRAYPVREHIGLIWAFLGDGEPPAFPPVPAFEGEGVLEVMAEPFPCNWFQSYENTFDEVHVAFVHREGGSHSGIYDLPIVSAEETDYGVKRLGTRANGQVRVSQHFLPNATRVIVPPMAGMEGVGGWLDTYLVLVPVDDENHIAFVPQFARIAAADQRAFRAQRERYQQRLAEAPLSSDVAQDVFEGKRSIHEVQHPDMVVVQDKVAQAGQGRIADREAERLGRSDAAIILLRKIYARELRALAGGRPIKRWACANAAPPTLGF